MSQITEKLLISLIPNVFEVSHLATICNRHSSTIRVHLVNNYIEDKDYYKQTPKKNSKILIAKAAAIQIRKHYAKK